MNAVLSVPTAEAGDMTAGRGWRLHLIALAVAVSAILLLFHADATGMVRVWMESQTFNHCALILPIIGWLVWQRLPELRQLEPRAWAPGLLLVAVGAAGWLLGEAGGVALARHAGLVLMLQGTVIACLGKNVARGLAFPIFYALFLIPAGQELVPPLQTITADICMALLGLVGIPAHIEGIFITVPTGYFEVAEACSGVQFLIAMLAYGALVANVCFRSWKRRALFMLVAVVIPIVANGVRAWGTIYIASLTSNDFAAGLDHVIYGWVFFALVIALVMAAGWPLFDRRASDPWFDPMKLRERCRGSSPIWPIAAATLGIAALPLAWSAAVASAADASPSEIILPAVPGWQPVPASGGRLWQPSFVGADLFRMARYRNAAGHEVDLAVAVFMRQQEGRELVGFGQGAVVPGGPWAWASNGPAPPGGRLDRIASHGAVREVATFYRVGSILTGSAAAVKLETMKTRLLGGPQRAVAVMVAAEAPAEGVSPRPAIDAFLKDLGSIEALADRAAGLPQR
ncbi:MAG: exosortase A [Pseudomonadota bacterium]|nr:exosortase A [Pseudomonadota bacterium]